MRIARTVLVASLAFIIGADLALIAQGTGPSPIGVLALVAIVAATIATSRS